MTTTIYNLINAIEKAYDVFKNYVKDNNVDVFNMGDHEQMMNEVFQELLELAENNDEDEDYIDDSDLK